MSNIYGNVAAAGEGSSMSIIEPGVHKVYVESVTVQTITTPKYNGEAADIKIAGVDGGTLTHRLFPFNFQADRTDYNGKLMTQEEQIAEYFSKLNHIFFKAAGSADRYTNATNGATSFTDLMNRINSVVSKNNGGVAYWQMVIADSNNYSKLPMWKGGCCEAINGDFPSTLKFDALKYGKKQPQGAEAATSGAPAVNQLPFD